MEHPSEEPTAEWTRLPSWLLARTAAHSHRLLADGFAALDANGHHFRLLATLEESGPASQGVLGRRSGIHVTDMVAAVNALADRDMVERTPDPTDRRRNVISLTTAGKRHLRKLEKRLAESQEQLMAPLSPQERQHLTELLGKLMHHHDHRTDTPDRQPGGQSAV